MGDGVQHGAAERLVQMLAQFVDMRPQGAAAGQIVAPEAAVQFMYLILIWRCRRRGMCKSCLLHYAKKKDHKV